MRIAIVYSVPTERAKQSPYVITDEDTYESARKIYTALSSKNAQVQLQPVTEDSLNVISNLSCDCIVNLIEWDDGDLPLSIRAFELLEETGVPFTGATKENYIKTTDKALMKKVFDDYGIKTGMWQVFVSGKEKIRNDFHYPLIAKLTLTHCSVGLSGDAIIRTPGSLIRNVKNRLALYKQPILVEEFIDGREFQITLIEESSGLTMLPPAEIVFNAKSKSRFLTFESRWVEDHPDYDTSKTVKARLTTGQISKFGTISKKIFRDLKFRDYARLDVRLRAEPAGDQLYILEANSNPGLDDTDDYGMTVSYKAEGMDFGDFMWKIISSAMRRARH